MEFHSHIDIYICDTKGRSVYTGILFVSDAHTVITLLLAPMQYAEIFTGVDIRDSISV